MGALARAGRKAVRRFGFDLQRFPESSPDWRKARLLSAENIDVVIDVGANHGQYGLGLRSAGYSGRIISFEPLSGPFTSLYTHAAGDLGWSAHQTAIGDSDGFVTLHVAANGGASSSALPMLNVHKRAAPEAIYVDTEDCPIHRLDSLLHELAIPAEARVLLKADVQGLEGAVLDGAARLLASNVVGVELELCPVPLYEGAMSWRDGIARAEELGLTISLIEPIFSDPSGYLLAADVMFFRRIIH